MQNVESDPREIGFAFHGAGTEIGQKGAFCKGLILHLTGPPMDTFILANQMGMGIIGKKRALLP
ncbi:MAG: hypothetical protein V3T59_06745, partial [Desulfobacterales bacterium]